MADPVVTITNGVPSTGTGPITTLGQTLLDGANATMGITTGAAVTTSVPGTLQQYLRGIVSLLVSGITVASHAVTNAGTFAVQATLQAGSALVGIVKVGDGTNTATVRAASSGAAVATDTAVVVSMREGVIATGTAGTPAANVLSIQGIAGATPVNSAQVATAVAAGFTSSRVNSAASTNATSLKASAGNIGEIDVFNNAAYAVFLKLYNKASAPTVGSDTPVWTIPIAAGGGYSKSIPRGKSFATGIAYAITKLQADSDTTVVVAGDLTGSIDWV